MRKREAVSKWQ